MGNLNYSRELYFYAKKALTKTGFIIDATTTALLDGYESVSKLHHKSVKFTLPNGGRLDNFKTGVLNIEEELHLPFKCICLEYNSAGSPRKDDEPYLHIEGVPQFVESETTDSPKRLVYALDVGEVIEITIAYTAFENTTKSYVWMVLPVFSVNKKTGEINYPKVFIVPFSDYADEFAALLLFIKALTCSNVSMTKLSPTVNGKANNKRKGFIPYDSYYTLTVDLFTEKTMATSQHGTHASPREHIRRGHVRTLASGKKIWVNDTVVNKGAPNAIIKTYEMA